MKAKNLAQLGLFLLVTALFIHLGYYKTEYGLIGAIGGLLVHYALTNKGNKNIINIRPLGAGFRVLLYDIYLITLLVALYTEAGDLSAFLDVLKTVTEKTVLLGLVALGLVVDYLTPG